MYFTAEDYKNISNYLARSGVKDSELPWANTITEEDTIAIVLDGVNKKVKLMDIIPAPIVEISNTLPIYNVGTLTNNFDMSLEQAVNTVHVSERSLGLLITFKEGEEWKLYLFTGNTIEDWNDVSLWTDRFETKVIIHPEDPKDPEEPEDPKEPEEPPVPIVVELLKADEEDLTVVEEEDAKILKFKDRSIDDDYVSTGYVILRRNPVVQSDNTVINELSSTACMKPNTVYEIRYDFDLKGKSLLVGNKSVLYFNGGHINNGSITMFDGELRGIRNASEIGEDINYKTVSFKRGNIFYGLATSPLYEVTDSLYTVDDTPNYENIESIPFTFDEGAISSSTPSTQWYPHVITGSGSNNVASRILDANDFAFLKSLIDQVITAELGNARHCKKVAKNYYDTVIDMQGLDRKRVVALEGDNNINKADIKGLKTDVSNLKPQVEALVSLDKVKLILLWSGTLTKTPAATTLANPQYNISTSFCHPDYMVTPGTVGNVSDQMGVQNNRVWFYIDAKPAANNIGLNLADIHILDMSDIPGIVRVVNPDLSKDGDMEALQVFAEIERFELTGNKDDFTDRTKGFEFDVKIYGYILTE